MSLKLNVGISQKIGQPRYGSLGASCYVEVELDQSLIFDDVEAFQERIQHAYLACRQAVSEELRRQPSEEGDLQTSEMSSPPGGQTDAQTNSQVNGQAHGQPNGQANSQANGHRASQRQLDYARQLATQVAGLGLRRLETLVSTMFDKPLADLSSLDASRLIDVLKKLKADKIDPATVLEGGTA